MSPSMDTKHSLAAKRRPVSQAIRAAAEEHSDRVTEVLLHAADF